MVLNVLEEHFIEAKAKDRGVSAKVARGIDVSVDLRLDGRVGVEVVAQGSRKAATGLGIIDVGMIRAFLEA